MTAVRVVCELAGCVADYAPQLDGLLVELASKRLRVPPDLLPRRHRPAPDPLDVPAVPLAREWVGGWPVFRVSAPVLPECPPGVAHFGKRIDTSRAGLLDPAGRGVVVTTNTWTKSCRLPVRRLEAARVVWFALTPDPGALLDLLGDCRHVGRKAAHGWGRVARWLVEPCGADLSWYAPCPETGRPVLMRALPLGPWLPAALDGWRADRGAVCPPYFHADRYCERAVPC